MSYLIRRIVFLSILFTLELVLITVWLDGQTLLDKGGLMAVLGLSGAWFLRGLVAFSALFVTFTLLQVSRDPDTLHSVSEQLREIPTVAAVWLALHAVLLSAFLVLARILFSSSLSGPDATPFVALWLFTGTAAIATGACIFIPLPSWRQVLRSTGNLWIYVVATTLAACLLGAYSRSLWTSAASWTFFLVKGLLTLVLSGVFTNLSTMSIGTDAFHVEISPQCSGLEGAALILGFCTLWLWLLRDEFRFPRALLLAPVSVAALFFLNAVRIAILILIGNAGAPDIALGGFHSQAGWIIFNGVAVVLMLATRRLQWITINNAGDAQPIPCENPSVPYLAPFLLTLAAAMISRAASAGFEWLYPLRLFAAGAALWVFRAHYKKLDWRFSWEAPVMGALVFAMWLAGDWLSGNHPQNPLIPSSDPWISSAQRLWLVLRLLSALVTVPIAEELAFRAYLIRRVISVDFEQLSPKAFTVLALAISSLAFGILHGERWIAGTVAGLIYAALLVRRGRIGDAIVAHATTNGLLAASVLFTGQWNLS